MQHNSLIRLATAAFAVASLVACTSTSLRQSPSYPISPNPPPTATAPPPAAPAAFIRPASGPTIARFDGTNNKGIDIAGALGDPIVASADGRVVYVGSELRGYGNMIIVKHNDMYLTAYAHNQLSLVQEKDMVRQGQTIARMGSSGADRVKLHFEIRKNGVAVNPEPYLQGKLR